MEKVWKIANLYIATLRAIYLIEQHAHWTTKGVGFYGDHLLFQRLYESATANADLAAEKFIGTMGEEALDYDTQCDLISKLVAKYADLKDEPVKQALTAEKDFLAFAEKAFKALEQEDAMTLGIDDAFTAISDKREGACYLLQQTLGKMKVAQAQDAAAVHTYLDNALRAAVANVGDIASSFHGELQGQAYAMFFMPALPNDKKTQILNNLHTMIKTNKPELEGQIAFKFA